MIRQMRSITRLAVLLSLACAFPALAAEPEAISLWEKGKAPDGKGGFTDEDATAFLHRPEKPNGTVVVICPGGGYGGLVIKPEGHGIAEWFNGHGITGVVLQYRLPKGRSMVPLLDARRAIQLARSKAAEWGCDPGKVGVMGFSAGGHLAATAATYFDKASRPDFAILVYPVITMGESTHGGSRKKLLGDDPSPEQIRRFSNELQVSADTPPTYLTHALDDSVVPIANSRMFAEAMKVHKVPCGLLELPSGGHGLNGYKGPMWEAWQEGCLIWLGKRGFVNGRVILPK